MYKNIFYSLVLFLWISFLLWWWITFWVDWVDCRTQETIPATHWSHFYTCEYPESSQRLQTYCNKDNTKSTLSTVWGCPKWLQCHICECTTNKWENGKCTITTGAVDGQEKGVAQTGTLAASTDPKDWSASSSSEITGEDNKNKDEEPCPWWLLNSQGKCCKKTYYDIELKDTVCCEGILLNTNVPFIWQCIVYKKASTTQPSVGLVVDENTAFPVLMWGLSRLLVSIILLISFVWILIGGVMISASWWTEEWAQKWRKIIGNVISALALLGASGVILQLINPNFFG